MDNATPTEISEFTKRFKSLVDAALEVDSPETFRDHKEFSEMAAELLADSNGAVKNWDLFRICRQLKLECIFSGSKNLKYINSIYPIWDSTRKIGPITNFANEKSWHEVIRLAQGHILACKSEEDLENQMRNTDVQLICLAESALRLRKFGYEISQLGDKFSISDAEEIRISGDIEKVIAKLGGLAVAGNVFNAASKFYNSKQERYHLVRRVSWNPRESSPNFPYGYILNLSAKHPAIPVNLISGAQDQWSKMVEVAVAYSAMLEVQPYTFFDGMFQDAHSILPYLKKNLIYDLTFTLPQLRPSDLGGLLTGLFRGLDEEQFLKKCGFSVNDYIAVQNAIFKYSFTKRHSPVIFQKEYLEKTCRIKKVKVKKILDVLVHKVAANAQFAFPYQGTKLDFQFKPLLQIDRKKWALLNPAWCSIGFYEALAQHLRDLGWSNIDGALGDQAEIFLRDALRKAGVKVEYGDYSHGKVSGDCDAVVETDDSIILIELKKKSLTRLARGGDEIQILIDASKSLVDAQLQAGKHELLLQSQGYIDLRNYEGASYRLMLNKRSIERVALTLTDYGSLQDRQVISNFLSVLLNARFDTPIEKWKKEFDELKIKCEQLVEQYVELKKTGAAFENIPYFNCWFVSVPQLLVLLDGVSSNDSFRSAMWSARHLTTASLDFYFEFSFQDSLHRANEGTSS